MEKRTILLLGAGAGIIGAIIFTFVLRGSFGHFLISICLGLEVAAIFLALGLIAMLVGMRWHRARWIATIAFALLSAVVIQMVSFPVGKFIVVKDVQHAKEFCESLVPSLDTYKKQHGNYPTDLDALISKDTKLPWLLRPHKFYSSDGENFSFSFSDPESMFDLYGYSNEKREWVRFD
ncbi:MAG TPA: hypothetical protein VM658_14945 [bacterium]|nr:hypothetical protein [bacterium]